MGPGGAQVIADIGASKTTLTTAIAGINASGYTPLEGRAVRHRDVLQGYLPGQDEPDPVRVPAELRHLHVGRPPERIRRRSCRGDVAVDTGSRHQPAGYPEGAGGHHRLRHWRQRRRRGERCPADGGAERWRAILQHDRRSLARGRPGGLHPQDHGGYLRLRHPGHPVHQRHGPGPRLPGRVPVRSLQALLAGLPQGVQSRCERPGADGHERRAGSERPRLGGRPEADRADGGGPDDLHPDRRNRERQHAERRHASIVQHRELEPHGGAARREHRRPGQGHQLRARRGRSRRERERGCHRRSRVETGRHLPLDTRRGDAALPPLDRRELPRVSHGSTKPHHGCDRGVERRDDPRLPGNRRGGAVGLRSPGSSQQAEVLPGVWRRSPVPAGFQPRRGRREDRRRLEDHPAFRRAARRQLLPRPRHH